MSWRWKFIDPVTSEQYEFEINPNKGGTPALKKNVQTTATTAPEPDSRLLMFEGRPQARQGSFSGTLLTEEALTAFEYWYNKRNQIYLTDDLNRTMTIYITSFSPERVRAATAPWKHTYTMEYTIVDWL